MFNDEGGPRTPNSHAWEGLIDRVNTTGTVLPRADGSAVPSVTITSMTRSPSKSFFELYAFFNVADDVVLEMRRPQTN